MLRPSSQTIVGSDGRVLTAIADAVNAEHPDQFVATMSKAKRRGKIFIDFLRNQRGASTVVAYSTRANPPPRFHSRCRGTSCRRSPVHSTTRSKTSLASWQSVSAIRGSKCCAAVNRSLRQRDGSWASNSAYLPILQFFGPIATETIRFGTPHAAHWDRLAAGKHGWRRQVQHLPEHT